MSGNFSPTFNLSKFNEQTIYIFPFYALHFVLVLVWFGFALILTIMLGSESYAGLMEWFNGFDRRL